MIIKIEKKSIMEIEEDLLEDYEADGWEKVEEEMKEEDAIIQDIAESHARAKK